MAGTQIMRKVKVEGGYLNFSSAHFITYSGKCERLHGHNYGVLVEVEGELGPDSLVFDFTILKKRTKEICQQLDHRFLLPLRNPHLELTRLPDGWEIRFRERRYVFPLSDVAELPIENSTSELLAQYICEKLCQVLEEYPTAGLHSIMVGVEEAPTQMAFYRQELHL
ncbi:6-pyruvoyl trahydropterin synthase family protein [Dictyobacter formicarum]|uniref:6-carboxy-5,6,7,8-tetrahydropterin synthase n=1 Tax=Dictyobacter formicarum TaxID=2778368 RepID=A0ABQ3VL47_9CHLR|nr:6-carboxytetrahydropterin synthase [Dictyobacter formicarum]GHO86111.1 6-pyruvoyl tetrahydrobiopterin synthase [Dictyobacter formicarum]